MTTVTPTPFDIHDMLSTGELVRALIARHPLLEPIRSAGIPMMLHYTPAAIWVKTGRGFMARVDWAGWWDSGRHTREDHAAWLAHRLTNGLLTLR